MGDSVISALAIVWATISDYITSITRDDIVSLLVAFAIGAVAPIARDRVEGWATRYINRFTNKGLRRIAASYAFWLAGVLFASAVALIELRNFLPPFVLGAVVGSSITAMITLSLMGWQARGPSKPNAVAFSKIFYEPTFAVVSPLLGWRTALKIIDSAPQIWQQFADVSLRLAG